jgi:hypothetical protein
VPTRILHRRTSRHRRLTLYRVATWPRTATPLSCRLAVLVIFFLLTYRPRKRLRFSLLCSCPWPPAHASAPSQPPTLPDAVRLSASSAEPRILLHRAAQLATPIQAFLMHDMCNRLMRSPVEIEILAPSQIAFSISPKSSDYYRSTKLKGGLAHTLHAHSHPLPFSLHLQISPTLY